MGRIGAQLSGIELQLLNRLNETNAAAALNSLRLTTGKKINSPSDSPNTFVQISGFESRLARIQSSISNVTSASSLVSQAQLTLDQVRTQLNTIRTTLLEDENQSLTSQQRSANQAEIDSALDAIRLLAGTTIDGKRILDGSAGYSVSGRNNAQVTGVDVFSLGGGTPILGHSPAELIYNGSSGLIADAANITITGSIGSQVLNLATTDSLAEVAYDINQASTSTGVEAEAQGDSLIIRSVGSGADQTITIEVNSGDFIQSSGNTITATGTKQVVGSTPQLAGKVVTAATRAQLTHNAGSATIDADANFTITGSRGSATIDVVGSGPGDEDLTLTQFADRINAESHNTGVFATADDANQDIILTSLDYGSDAQVSIAVNSGTFATTNELGVLTTSNYGTNAVAQINGRLRSGNAAATAAELIVHTTDGTLANDAQLQLITASGTTDISIDTVAETNDTLTKLKTTIDAIDGVTAYIVDNDLVIQTDATGAASTLEIRTLAGTFAVDGGNGDGSANGTDASTGNSTVDGNKFTIVENGLHATIEFAADFTGSFDTISLDGGGALTFALSPDLNRTSTLSIRSLMPNTLGGASGNLEDLRSGGTAAGLGANTSLAIRIVDEALGQLDLVEGQVDGFANATIASAAALHAAEEESLIDTLDSINSVNEIEEELLLAKNQALASNAVSAMSILDSQRNRIVELIQQIAGL